MGTFCSGLVRIRLNAKVEQFYTRFWSEKSTGVDAFMENWGDCNGYFVWKGIGLIIQIRIMSYA